MNSRSLIRTGRPGWLAAVLCFLPLAAVPAAEPSLQFNRDIRPILSEYCLNCHGPDTGTRKAGLRLDDQRGLYGETRKDGPVVAPGAPERSVLWRRINSNDPDYVMPHPEAKKVLPAEDKARLKRWIEEGAAWQSHWAFIKPDRPPVPTVRNAAWVRNPIDAFILAGLERKGLEPAPEADRRTLGRRASLDLTGLPPTPAEVEALAGDASAGSFERYVQKKLESPHWGEHRARAWLDAARYADTHGLHFDNYREMWPYRDWVIGAFNRNQPFDQFTIEQIAGDLLPHPSQDQLIATGFHRCNMTTNEGGTIEEENQANYANDRVVTTSWVWLGVTANCASCHDHKFDPFTMRDFYSMAAYFRNTTQGGYDGNVKDSNPSIPVIDRPIDYARWTELPDQIKAARERVEQRRKGAEPAFEKWLAGLRSEDLERALERALVFRAGLMDGRTNRLGASIPPSTVEVVPTGTVSLMKDGILGPAPAFGTNGTAAFPGVADFEWDQPFSYGAWVWVPEKFDDTVAVLARMGDKPDYRGWDLWIQKKQFAAHIVGKWSENAIKVRTKDVVKPGRWQHVFATYDGSGRASGLKLFVDGAAVETQVENGRGLSRTIRTDAPLTLAQRRGEKHFDGSALQDVRIYARVLAPAEVLALANATNLAGLLAAAPKEEKEGARKVFLNWYLATEDTGYQYASAELAALEEERDRIRRQYPVTHIQQEKKDSAPMAAVLFRGRYDRPRDKVPAGVFAALNPLPANAPSNRLGLAQWLVSPDNPLMARVIVNRFWQEVFGIGLVKTAEDFGTMGEMPVNQALLDWLAVEFRESGWDVKRLFTLMVTSATYRQSSVTTPLKLEKDPGNRLLSRGPRFRMDAEMIRDYALAASGLLVPKVGGPSVKPYQPDGVWEAVAMPESDTKKYQRGSGEALYRRSLYTFWKRAAPPATMDILNAPSRETACTRRERTNTPLQALATLNDPQFVEAARRLAESAWKEARGNADRAVEQLAVRILGRPLRGEERPVVAESMDIFLKFYDGHPDESRSLVSVGETKPDRALPMAKVAALTMMANQFLNMDETLNK